MSTANAVIHFFIRYLILLLQAATPFVRDYVAMAAITAAAIVTTDAPSKIQTRVFRS